MIVHCREIVTGKLIVALVLDHGSDEELGSLRPFGWIPESRCQATGFTSCCEQGKRNSTGREAIILSLHSSIDAESGKK